MSRLDKHERKDRIKWAIVFLTVAALIVGFFAIVTKGFKQNDPKTWFSGNKIESVAVQNGGTVELSSGAKLVNHPDSPWISYTVENNIPYITFTDPNELCLYEGFQSYVQYFYMYYIGLDKNGQSSHGQYYPDDGFFAWTRKGKVTVQSFMDNVRNKPDGGMPVGYYDIHFSIKYFEEKDVMDPNDPTFIEAGQTRIKYGSWSDLPANPSKIGYNFAGWYTDENFTTPYNKEYVTSDINLYAKFEAINYSINYNVYSGSVNGKKSYTIEDETYTLPTPTLTGYNFMGWYEDDSFLGEPVTKIESGTVGERTFYAKWEIQTFTVSFYVDGELYLEMVVEYGTQLVNLYLVDTQTLEAVAFSLDAEMFMSYDTSAAITNDLSLFASERFAVYAGLTYNIDGVETMDLLDYNSTLSDLRVPEKDGYTFDGWYYDSEYKNAVKSTDKLTQNKTIYAKFTATPKTFWAKVGAFFKQWWWCFAVGFGGIVVITVISVIFEQKKKKA